MRALLVRVGALGVCLTSLLLGFFLVVRPWYRTWGADPAVQQAALPGDHLLWQGTPRETRAIVIRAPAEKVWPWVAQIGQDRGGFYSFEILEDLAGCEMTNLAYLVPSLQHWRTGDKLWMYPPEKARGIGQAPLAQYEPGHALVFYTRRPGTSLSEPPDGTWAFVVEPVDAAHARFIMRGRGRGSLGLLGTAFERSIFEPIHFAMERKMMEGVKARAEGRAASKAADNTQVLLWTTTFIAFLSSGLMVLAGHDWRRRAVTFMAAGLLFGLLTLVQPSIALGMPLTIALCLGVWWPSPARR